MNKKIQILLITISFFWNYAGAQSENPFYRFHRLNENDGLSNNIINDIVQDSTGFIWLATDDGLFKYNGIDFKIYRHHPDDSASLPHNSVQRLYLDKLGKLWALTDYGIGIYDSKSDRITRIEPGEAPGQLPHKSITSLCCLGSEKIIIGTFGGGVIYGSDNGYIQLTPDLNPDDLDLTNQLVSDLLIDNDSVLWIGTWNEGLLRYDLKNNVIGKAITAVPNNYRVFFLEKLSDNSIWAGTNIGLVVFRRGYKEAEVFNTSNSEWLLDDEILSLMEDESGSVWIGTRGAGMVYLDRHIAPGSGKPNYTLFEPSTYLNGVSHRTISKIFKDSFGNIWLGTHNSGINVFNPSGESVRTFTYVPNTTSLSHQSVWGICEGEPGSIWVGTDGGGLNSINPYNQKVKNYPLDMFSDVAILCSLLDSHNNLWIGTYSGGINIYDQEDGTTRILNSDNGLLNNDIRVLYEDSQLRVWIGTNGSGLYVYNSKSNKANHIVGSNNIDIRGIEQGDSSTLWLATFGLGLVNYNLLTDSLAIYNWHKEGEETPVALSILRDKDNIWVGTRQNGLLKFDIATSKFYPVTDPLDPTGSSVRSIIKDTRGRIWFSTNTGISCLDPKSNSIYNFDASDGLQVGQFNDGSGILLSTGDLAFGGIHGLSVFSPDELLNRGIAPEVVISEINVLRRREKGSDSGQITIIPNNKPDIRLKYNENTIIFRYNALVYPDASKWIYDYRLEGVDDDWILGEQLRSLTFRNLEPGHYKLSLRTSGITGTTITGPVKTISFTILPPIWRTIPAYIAYTLLILVSVLLILRYNINRVRLKQQLHFEKKLRQQEKEVIQQKIRFFTNFSHELRSPLTLIQGPVDELIADSNLQDKQPLLHLIKRNTAILQRLVNRLLEFRKIETQTTTLNIGMYNISDLVLEESENFRYRASQLGSKIETAIEKDILCWVDIEKIRIVINNLLSNAVKYTPSNGLIKVLLQREFEKIILVVKDTGIGIDEKDIDTIFSPFFQSDNSAGMGGTGIGLSLARSFAELHRGIISVDSGKDSGSSFRVEIPADLREFTKDDENVKIIEPDSFPEPTNTYKSDEEKSESEVGKLVLVVDDNADIRLYINHLLEKDYKVLTAEDGNQGFNIAINEIPDIIVSDIMMPELDGIGMCKKIKSTDSTNHIPLILLTAMEADTSRIEGYSSGADAYITKPFSPVLLITRIENLLEQRERIKDFYQSSDWEVLRNNDSPNIKFIKHAEETIISMLTDGEVTVPDLASELGFSRTSLYRKIKVLTGLSINHFIRRVKIRFAAHILSYEDVTVSEVAFSIGFTDLKYFRSCFKEVYKMLPSDYQKQQQQKDSGSKLIEV